MKNLSKDNNKNSTNKVDHKPKLENNGVRDEDPQVWILSDFMFFNLILIVRLWAVFTTSISDCDETFNYWEPTHFLLYGKGQQTWEYDPKFALRSYFYIILHALPGYLLNLVVNVDRIVVFYLIKSTLALLCTLCEVHFYKGVSRIASGNVGQIALLFSTFSTGMFISSTSFLPSSTSMLLLMISHGAWFRKSYNVYAKHTQLRSTPRRKADKLECKSSVYSICPVSIRHVP